MKTKSSQHETQENVSDQPQHMPTPLPWKLGQNNCKQWTYILNQSESDEVARGEGDNAEANAAFIVRAVNAHNDLLEIAKDALCELDPDCKYDGVSYVKGMTDRQCLIIGLYEAIAKVEGK